MQFREEEIQPSSYSAQCLIFGLGVLYDQSLRGPEQNVAAAASCASVLRSSWVMILNSVRC